MIHSLRLLYDGVYAWHLNDCTFVLKLYYRLFQSYITMKLYTYTQYYKHPDLNEALGIDSYE